MVPKYSISIPCKQSDKKLYNYVTSCLFLLENLSFKSHAKKQLYWHSEQ